MPEIRQAEERAVRAETGDVQATYVRKIAELRAEKLKVKPPLGVDSTTFDRSTGKYVVTFAENIEGAI